MNKIKIIVWIFPWIVLSAVLVVLFFSDYSFFNKKSKIEKVDATLVLQEIEQLGKLELVKYNFKEIFDYRQLSEGKMTGSSLLKTYDYSPDLSVVLVAAGEAVGCIDLQKLQLEDISLKGDTLVVVLPSPELCYHKLDMEKTRIFSFKNDSWWSRLFSDENESQAAMQAAYRQAERKIRQAALEAGILANTNEQARNMLQPMFEGLTGKTVTIVPTFPRQSLQRNY